MQSKESQYNLCVTNRLPLLRSYLWALSGWRLLLVLLRTGVPLLSRALLLFLQNLRRKPDTPAMSFIRMLLYPKDTIIPLFRRQYGPFWSRQTGRAPQPPPSPPAPRLCSFGPWRVLWTDGWGSPAYGPSLERSAEEEEERGWGQSVLLWPYGPNMSGTSSCVPVPYYMITVYRMCYSNVDQHHAITYIHSHIKWNYYLSMQTDFSTHSHFFQPA